MNEPLRPSSLGEILDRTAQLYRSRFLVFLGISVLPVAVMVVLLCLVGLVATWWGTAGAHSVSSGAGYILVALFFIGGLLVALPVLLAVTALASAAMSHAVASIHLGGTTTIRDAYKSVWPRGWRYIGLYLLRLLVAWAVPIAVWLALLFLFGAGAAVARSTGRGDLSTLMGLAAILASAVMIGYGIWMLIRLSLAFPAAVVEQAGAWSAIMRSFALSQGSKGRILLLYLLAATLGWILSIAVILPLAILVSLIPGIDSPPHVQTAEVVLTPSAPQAAHDFELVLLSRVPKAAPVEGEAVAENAGAARVLVRTARSGVFCGIRALPGMICWMPTAAM